MTVNSSTPPSPLARLQAEYRAYPSQFWLVVLASFIDRLGGSMLFPFFTLYLTRKFEIGMTQVGVIFGLFSLSSVVGSMAGGVLTDRLGRKGMIIFGLVMSATTTLLLGVINRLELFFIVVLIVGMMAETGGPAQQALIGDLLPEEKRVQGFGILRVVFNLAVAIGPLIGGLLASRSYMLLFISDAVTSLVTALLVYIALKETWSPQQTGKPPESMGETFAGYRDVLRDTAFVWYMGASVLMTLVYIQMNTTLPVYLRDQHGVNEQAYGFILSLNAGMVVLFQFPITHWISRFRPLLVMAVGALIYAVGFALYGMVTAYFLFLIAMVIITIAEMMVSPVGQAIVLRLSPEAMRGRYMAAYGFSWVIPFAIGPLLSGMLMDTYNPDYLWWAAGVIGGLAALAFLMLEHRVGRSRWGAVDRRLKILQQVEEGHLSAEAANQLLEQVSEGSWGRLAPGEAIENRNLRIQLSDRLSGEIKLDILLPLGLVHTALNFGGKLSSGLDAYDPLVLKTLIERSVIDKTLQQLDNGVEVIEVEVQ